MQGRRRLQPIFTHHNIIHEFQLLFDMIRVEDHINIFNTNYHMYNLLGHTCADRFLLSIKYSPCNYCECIFEKQTHQLFHHIDDTALSQLFCVSCDLCSEIRPKSYGDGQFVLTITD